MERDIIISNLSLHYYSNHDQVANQAVIFLHGWRSEGRVWLPLWQKLNLSSDWTLLALDFPGFGSSKVPPSNFNISQYAELLSAFINKLNLTSVILVGHSFGGRVAIKLSGSHPNFLKQLILIDSAGFADRSFKKKLLRSLAKLLKPAKLLPGFSHLRRLLYRFLGTEDYLATPHLTNVFQLVIREDLSRDMSNIKVPTLIIWGADDKVTPLREAHRLSRLIKNSELKIMSTSGHFSFLDNPDLTVKYLSEFIS